MTIEPTNVSEGLEPCPLCGATEIRSRFVTGMVSLWRVDCAGCHVNVEISFKPFDQEAREKARVAAEAKWNTRLSPPLPSRASLAPPGGLADCCLPGGICNKPTPLETAVNLAIMRLRAVKKSSWARSVADQLASALAAATPLPSPGVERLFRAIEHGDPEHRAWLRDALEAYFSGKPVPPVRSQQPALSALPLDGGLK